MTIDHYYHLDARFKSEDVASALVLMQITISIVFNSRHMQVYAISIAHSKPRLQYTDLDYV